MYTKFWLIECDKSFACDMLTLAECTISAGTNLQHS